MIGMSEDVRVSTGGHSRSGNGHQSLESAQHLIVGGIIRDLVRLPGEFTSEHKRDHNETPPYRVYVSNDSGYSRQPGPSAGDDTYVLVRVLADLSLPVCVVVEVCDGLTEF